MNICPYYEEHLQAQRKTGQPSGVSSLWRQSAPAKQLNNSVPLSPGMMGGGLGNIGGLQIPQTGATEHTIERPVRAPEMGADVGVPLATAFVTGVMIAAPTFTILMALEFTTGDSLTYSAIVGMIGIVGMWFKKMGTFDSLLWFVESVTHTDINQDAHVGPPPAEPIRLDITTKKDKDGYQMIRPWLPEGVGAELFYQWANQVTTGIATPARRNWVGKGKPFTEGQYTEMVNNLIDANVMQESGKGHILTAGGHHALKAALRESGRYTPSPTP